MRAQTSIGLILLALAACTPRTQDRPASPAQTSAAPPVAIRIVAFNDFHGNLPPPRQYITAQTPTGPVKVPAGGGAYFASAIAKLKAENPLNIVVSAGDMTGASPLMSSLFLDEPTIEAMNLIGVDLNAAGNHEFDRGQDELKRLQTGGCAKFAAREPCQLSPKFPGASFQYLAANSVRQDGSTLFPPYAIRTFGEGKGAIKVGFIGTTLKGTAEIVSAAGIAGIHFADEAKTANALIPELRAKGADVIVVLVHEGGRVTAPHGAPSCAGLEGDILPVLDALDPAVDIVISGHTHREYVCDFGTVNPAKPFLLTSAGQYGTLVTSIDIAVDPLTRKLVSKHAENVIVQGEAYDGGTGRVDLTNAAPVYPADPRIKALIDRYSAASATFTQRVVGHATGAILRASTPSGEQAAGNLIADAQLAALRGPGGAQLAFMNQGGVRADILTEPDGS
ncbi:MAG: metallophosphoesterase, partial [Sphingobium sp.]